MGIQGPREVHVQLSTSNLQVCLSIGNFSRFIKQAAVVVSLRRQREREGEASQARRNAARTAQAEVPPRTEPPGTFPYCLRSSWALPSSLPPSLSSFFPSFLVEK